MPEEPTGSQRPGEQQPAAGEPAPPPPPAGPAPGHPEPGPPWQGHSAPGHPAPGHPAPGYGQGYTGPGYPPGAYAPPPRRLMRRTDERVLGGVASGLGLYFGVDPVVFRIGFVVLSVVGGSGLLVYLLLWAILPPVSYAGAQVPPPGAARGPRHGEPAILAMLRQGGAKSFLAIGAFVLALLLLVSPFARPTVVIALVLIGVGVLLMAQDRPSEPADPAGQGAPEGTPPAAGGTRPWDQPAAGGGTRPWCQPAGPGGEPAGPRGEWEQGAPRWQPGDPYQGQSAGAASWPAPSATATLPGGWGRGSDPGDPGAGSGPPAGQYPTGGAGWGPAGTAQGGYGHPASWASRTASGQYGAEGPAVAWGAGTAGRASRRQPRPRSVLGWLTVAAALLTAGVASALDNLGVVHLTATRILALALIVIGAGLLVGSLWGRAWWLVLLGLLLVPALGAASLVNDVPLSGRNGDVVARPFTLVEVQSEYKLSGGQLTLDLSQVDFGAAPRRVSASVAAGSMRVLLPDGQPVAVSAKVSAGEMEVLGHNSDGLQISDRVSEGGVVKGHGLLTLDLRAGVGQIVVTRGP